MRLGRRSKHLEASRLQPGAFAVVIALALSVSTGCATAGAPHCSPGPAKPFTVGHVLQTLKQVGIEAYQTPRDAGGCAPGTVAFVSNIQSTGPHANLQQSNSIIERFGNVSCEIDVKPVFPAKTRLFRYEGGARVVIDRANVECSIHPHTTGLAAVRKVQRLKRAVDLL
jgi:hypothetical protein